MNCDEQTWGPLISRVAKWIGHDFPGCELEDLEQGLWVFFLENRKEFTDPEEEGVFSALCRGCKQVAWNDRKEGMQTSVQYHYRPSDVRKLMETVFDTSQWCNAVVPEDAKSLKKGDAVEMSADLDWAIQKLTLEDRKLLFGVYALGEKPNGPTESKRLTRAIDKTIKILNSYTRGQNG